MELLGFIVMILGSLALMGVGLIMLFVTTSFGASDQGFIGFCVMIIGGICLYLVCQHAPFHVVWGR